MTTRKPRIPAPTRCDRTTWIILHEKQPHWDVCFPEKEDAMNNAAPLDKVRRVTVTIHDDITDAPTRKRRRK